MSTPGPQPTGTPGPSTTTSATPPAGPPATTSKATATTTSPATPSTTSTPRFLRVARAAAAAAALLTGVAATGTFSTGGINATPNVIAGEWTAAEQAGVRVAEADLLAATRLAAEDPQQDVEAYDAAVGQASRDLGRMGDPSGDAASDWSAAVLGAERAVAVVAEEGSASDELYAPSSALARAAAAQSDVVAERHADDLLTGSRSMLTAIVGTLGTLVLAALLVRLALRTRRILNVPLLAATLITGGLTYLSVNPSALPLDYDQRVTGTTDTAQALQTVYQARQAQQAQALGVGEDADAAAATATSALERLDDDDLVQAWDRVSAAAADPEGVAASQQDFDAVREELDAMFADRVGRVAGEVSAPAVITSGMALLLGLAGAWLAWAGVSQRLRDYR